jgi:hypothetical protein
MYYIRNTKNDCNYDLVEGRFYSSTWQPELEDDKEHLQSLIDSDPETFKDCIVETI